VNEIARRIVESRRGIHSENVVTYKGKRAQKINTHAFHRARTRARIPEVPFPNSDIIPASGLFRANRLDPAALWLDGVSISASSRAAQERQQHVVRFEPRGEATSQRGLCLGLFFKFEIGMAAGKCLVGVRRFALFLQLRSASGSNRPILLIVQFVIYIFGNTVERVQIGRIRSSAKLGLLLPRNPLRALTFS
jgi:hypothetical protein